MAVAEAPRASFVDRALLYPAQVTREGGDAARILVVSNFYPPESLGGAEYHARDYALELVRRGYSVQILAGGSWEGGNRYWSGYRDHSEQGVAIRRVDLDWRRASDPNRSLYSNPVVGRHFETWLDEWRPDLVHVVSCYTLSAEILEIAHRRRIPVLLHLTDFWFLCPKTILLRGDGTLCDGRTTPQQCIACLFHGQRPLEWARRAVGERAAIALLDLASRHPSISRVRPLRGRALDIRERKTRLVRALTLADRVIALSEHLRRIFVATGARSDMEVITAGHDLPQPSERREAPELRFGFLGQVKELKGVHLAVEAYLSASLERPASLTVWGGPVEDNPYRDQLVARAEGRRDVRFPGVLARQDLSEGLAAIDVLIVPSLWHENYPRVVREAFHCGVPVLASDVGGIADFVRDGVDGLVFARGSVAALRRQIERVASEPALLPRLRSGLPVAKTVAQEADELEAVYRDLLDRPRRREKARC